MLAIAHVVSFQAFSPFCNLCNGLEIMHNEKKQATPFSYWTVGVGTIETIVCLINCVYFDVHVGRLLETWKWIFEYRRQCTAAGEADLLFVLYKDFAPWLHLFMSGNINILFNYKTSTVTARTLQNRGSSGIDSQDFKTGM